MHIPQSLAIFIGFVGPFACSIYGSFAPECSEYPLPSAKASGCGERSRPYPSTMVHRSEACSLSSVHCWSHMNNLWGFPLPYTDSCSSLSLSLLSLMLWWLCSAVVQTGIRVHPSIPSAVGGTTTFTAPTACIAVCEGSIKHCS